MTNSLSRSTPASASLRNPDISIALKREDTHFKDSQDPSKNLFELVPVRRASTGELSERLPAPRKITLVEVHHVQTVSINPAPEVGDAAVTSPRLQGGRRNKAVEFGDETTTIVYPKSPRSNSKPSRANKKKIAKIISPRGRIQSTSTQPTSTKTISSSAAVALNESLNAQIQKQNDRVTIELRNPGQPQNPSARPRLQRTSHFTSGVDHNKAAYLAVNTIEKIITTTKEHFAASPPKRMLNILYCATGSKSRLDEETYPEVVAFGGHLQGLLSLTDRFEYLEGLYGKLKENLSPRQQNILDTAFESAKKTNDVEIIQKALKNELKKIN
ncbi:hypothetical protein [Variovorax defluvii]|uniref:hypothetical protein n=1 Tax=Variovorax defluvii TaxID=913761 RepID=UPI0031E58933